VGIALALRLPGALLSLVPAIVACHYILIRPEERYLAARFDVAYSQYAASVRRWLGRVRRER
jgi:protein-S-isoprenylcysteine O-methyltransferase Ste14